MKGTAYKYPPTYVQASFPVLYLALAAFTDHLIAGGTITPALLTLGLLGMTFFWAPRWMVFAASLYALCVAGVFFLPPLQHFANSHYYDGRGIEISFILRSSTFALVGCFSILFSIVLKRNRTAHREIDEIISRFPYPLVVSEQSGLITYANKEAEAKFRLPGSPLTGGDFTHLFVPSVRKSDFYFEYALRFNTAKASEITESGAILPVEFNGNPLLGDTLLLESGKRKQLLTIFLELDPEAKPEKPDASKIG
jgi:PAS domain-containing protein